jgi:hypothetical protein
MIKDRMFALLVSLAATCVVSCWDEIDHQVVPVGNDLDASTEWVIPPEWSGFGTACSSDNDCGNYPSSEKRCIHNCVGLINTPGGYCTGCCDKAGKNLCAPGIDCVGYDNVYLVCLAHCNSDTDCRQEEGYECRTIYYIPDDFPGNYCLPKEEFVEPDDADASIDEALCPWPWLER